MKGYILPPQLDREIDELESLVERYKSGAVTFDQLKAHRVPFGVYEQREPHTYMVRIRCAAGFITPSQLEGISELSRRYGQKAIHLTTRQELQIHYVELDNIVPIIRAIRELGLATRGGGGNTVRNITASCDAGIAKNEVFDVFPYAIALTTRLIEEDDSWTLPRKFKITFSGSSDDKGYATIADVGFIALEKSGKKGFKVFVAGGLGSKSQTAKPLFDFIPEEEVYNVAKAVKNIFWKYGNRRNKHAARLRFLWRSLGGEEFKKKFNEEYEALKELNYPPLKIIELANDFTVPNLPVESVSNEGDFLIWKRRFVEEQKQKNLFSILIPVELGFIKNEETSSLARFLKAFGDNVIRLTKEQNFLLRNIHEDYLGNVYNFLKKNKSNFNRPIIYDTLISCAGASTCQLGICLSRGAAEALKRCLEKSGLDLDKLSGVKLNISGCPNACGQHPAADLGFFGKAARKGDKLYPAYNVVAGAVIKPPSPKLAQVLGEVSAKDLPKLVKDFFGIYISKLDKSLVKDFNEYISQEGKEDLKLSCRKYTGVPDFDDDKNYYFDWGTDKLFSLAERRSGECSAGIFDLIDMDLKNINIKISELKMLPEKADLLQRGKLLLELVFYSSRMLLITRGVEPKTEKEAYDNFIKHFIQTNLVNDSFRQVIEDASTSFYENLAKEEKEVLSLAERVKYLYDVMDNSFQFVIEGFKEKKPRAESLSSASLPKVVKDFRGVTCPMNFVKTKIELEKLKTGDILEIWLDEGEPIENVPGSIKQEGHEIIEQKKKDRYWSVVIKKR